MNLRVEFVEHPSETDCDAVNTILRSHNESANPVFWKKRALPEHEPLPLKLFAYSDDQEIIGGLFAQTSFRWLRIDILAVQQSARTQGVGTSLLLRAEEIARERGCTYAFLDTMDYQAPNFYKKRGYELVGELPDWDSYGHAKMLFRKAF